MWTFIGFCITISIIALIFASGCWRDILLYMVVGLLIILGIVYWSKVKWWLLALGIILAIVILVLKFTKDE